jgi:hypothetical protein
MGRPQTEQTWQNRRNQDTMVQLAGGLEAADERIAAPYTPYVPPYIWNSASHRYHWREDGQKRGKKIRKGSFHAVPDSERKLYNKRLAVHRQANKLAEGGSRLKKRS